MKTSAAGIALIKRFEGLELEAYQDIAGVWTIGYGHTESVRPGEAIDEAGADARLIADLVDREAALSGWSIMHGVELNQNEFDALIAFVFNVGFRGFAKSTAATRLKKGDRAGGAEALTWWNKATVAGRLREVTGLTRRRAAEKMLFLTPVAGETPNNPDRPNFLLDEISNARPTDKSDPLAGFRLPTLKKARE